MKIILYSTLGLSIIAFDSMILKAAELNTANPESQWQQSYVLETKSNY